MCHPDLPAHLNQKYTWTRSWIHPSQADPLQKASLTFILQDGIVKEKILQMQMKQKTESEKKYSKLQEREKILRF